MLQGERRRGESKEFTARGAASATRNAEVLAEILRILQLCVAKCCHINGHGHASNGTTRKQLENIYRTVCFRS